MNIDYALKKVRQYNSLIGLAAQDTVEDKAKIEYLVYKRNYYLSKLKEEEFFKDFGFHEKKFTKEEYEICSHFGCAKKLSLIEKLAGNKCTKHMKVKKELFVNGLL